MKLSKKYLIIYDAWYLQKYSGKYTYTYIDYGYLILTSTINC